MDESTERLAELSSAFRAVGNVIQQMAHVLSAADEAEFWSMPDVLEADVAATAWYPQAP